MILLPRWLWLFGMGGIPLLFTGIWRGAFEITLLWYGLCVALGWLDWRHLPEKAKFRFEREVEPRWVLGTTATVLLRVENSTAETLHMTLKESPPLDVQTDLSEGGFAFVLQPHTRHTLSYTLTPERRGDSEFGDLYVRVEGRMRFTARQWKVSLPASVPVYPNLFKDASPALIARRGRLQMGGMRSVRIQGIGREFESLRDYQADDEMRRIDWKATARRGKLISRQYEAERSQNIFLVFDLGRTMLAEVAGVPKIDYALNAALLLAYVATQSEDHVGLLTFGERVESYLPPRKGGEQMEMLLNALYRVQASLQDSDYGLAFAELESRWRKRSLVLCFTDLWDTVSSQRTIEALSKLQSRHLVVVVSLLDTNLLENAEKETTTSESIYQKSAAIQVLEERRKALRQLEQGGILVIDTPSDRLSAELVRHYLEIKDRVLL